MLSPLFVGTAAIAQSRMHRGLVAARALLRATPKTPRKRPPQAPQRGEVVEQLLRIGRSRRLVELGGRVEGAPEWFSHLAHPTNRPRKRRVLRIHGPSAKSVWCNDPLPKNDDPKPRQG